MKNFGITHLFSTAKNQQKRTSCY